RTDSGSPGVPCPSAQNDAATRPGVKLGGPSAHRLGRALTNPTTDMGVPGRLRFVNAISCEVTVTSASDCHLKKSGDQPMKAAAKMALYTVSIPLTDSNGQSVSP